MALATQKPIIKATEMAICRYYTFYHVCLIRMDYAPESRPHDIQIMHETFPVPDAPDH